jgi:mannose-6-phosphate isomerase
VIRFGEHPCGKINPVRVERGAVTETYLAACRYFATEKWELSQPISSMTSREHFDLLVFLKGSGSIRWARHSAEYAPAQVWIIPAALGEFQLSPNKATSLLRTYVPSGTNEFWRKLEERGVTEAEWSRLVHS